MGKGWTNGEKAVSAGTVARNGVAPARFLDGIRSRSCKCVHVRCWRKPPRDPGPVGRQDWIETRRLPSPQADVHDSCNRTPDIKASGGYFSSVYRQYDMPDLLAALERLAHPMADDEDLDYAREVIAKAKGQQ